jgi:hypothetical protein
MRLALLAFPVLALAALSGCSDPVPPTPQGAFSVSFSQPGAGCSIGSHNAAVGLVDDKNRTTIVVDGNDGADISCSVVGGTSGPFKVDAQLVKEPNGLIIAIPSLSPKATKDAPSTGTVGFLSDRTAGKTYTSPTDTPCNFYFVPSTNEGVAAGKVWLAFNCPTLVSPPDQGCAISQGYAIFENCSVQ